jgi:D-aminoacyl-tRNA deacylase
MRIVLQRASHGRVTVEGQVVAEIERGMVLLVGVGPGDGEAQARSLAEKVAHLRIFEDPDGKMNLSVLDSGGRSPGGLPIHPIRRYSQRPAALFYGRSLTGNRRAARGALRRLLLRELGVPCQTGRFGAHMLVEIANDGPVTIWLESTEIIR